MEDRVVGVGSQEVEEGRAEEGGGGAAGVKAWGAWTLDSGVWTHQVRRWRQGTPRPGGGGAR